MTEPPAPPRLKSGKDVPPELQRALRALGNQDTHHPRLGRVAEKLGPLLDAPPPAPPSLLHARHLHQGFAAKVVVAALAIGASAIGLTGLLSQPEKQQETVGRRALPALVAQPAAAVDAAGSRPAVPAAARSERLDPAPSRSPLIDARNVEREDVEREVPTPRADLGAKRPRAQASARRAAAESRPDRAAPGSRRRVASSSTSDSAAPDSVAGRIASDSAQGNVSSDPAGSVDSQARPDSVAVAVLPDNAASPTARPDSTRVLPARGEVELLIEARTLMARDPAAALRVLQEHEARFADGMLVPEREVLAVEVLRRLGQTATAEQRLRAFRARYPGSLHLQRLGRDVR